MVDKCVSWARNHNGCAMRRAQVNRIVAPTGSGAIERGGIMQPSSILLTIV